MKGPVSFFKSSLGFDAEHRTAVPESVRWGSLPGAPGGIYGLPAVSDGENWKK